MDKGILLATKTFVESMSLYPGPEWCIFRWSRSQVAYRYIRDLKIGVYGNPQTAVVCCLLIACKCLVLLSFWF